MAVLQEMARLSWMLVALLSFLGYTSSFMPCNRRLLRLGGGRATATSSMYVQALRRGTASGSLLPDPLPNSIGNYFDNTTEGGSFIQCYMLNLADIGEDQYGVGFPVDTPVMVGYFEGTEFMAVEEDYPDYDHLMNHVAVQMDSNDLQLYRTPVVLTLQGELDETDDEYEDEEVDDDDEYDDDEEELTLEELLALEDEYDEEDENIDDEEYDDGDEDIQNGKDERDPMSKFMNESPVGKIDPKYNAQPDVTIFRPKGGVDTSDLPEDAFVTEEDTKALKAAHRRADKIISFASDIKLIASFHYKKRNYHLVKLLEPLFIVGKRIPDIKGYYFNLLEGQESAKITPVLEKLLAERNEEDKRRVRMGLSPSTAPIQDDRSGFGDDTELALGDLTPAGGNRRGGKGRGGDGRTSSSPSVGSSRRSWRDRKKRD